MPYKSGSRLALACLLLPLALSGCATLPPDSASITPRPVLSPTPTSTWETVPPTPTSSITPTAELPATPEPTPALTGRLIVIDPGHNGGWTRQEYRLVPDGNGRKKACNSTGTATNDGYAEHAYNWAQAQALDAELRARGAKVLFTRKNDQGRGPCVNLRANQANQNPADLLISIHADGDVSRSARGFHVIISPVMAGGKATEKASRALARKIRDALQEGTAMPRSTYIGNGTALSPRDDIATLNFSKRPAVMMEMGNMRHSRDAALLKSAAFRRAAAQALAEGITAYLNGNG